MTLHDGWHDAYCADTDEMTWLGQALLLGLLVGAAGWCLTGFLAYRAWRVLR